MKLKRIHPSHRLLAKVVLPLASAFALLAACGSQSGPTVTGITVTEADGGAVAYAGWPYTAEMCTYNNGLQVAVADPSADRVARWIVESSELIDTLASLKTRDRAHYEAGLVIIARNVLGQSSRIFPLGGQLDEGTVYHFTNGVTRTCSTGCFCRVNSTDRPTWCKYIADTMGQDEAACLTQYGTAHWSDAWGAHCLQNHADSWLSDRNPHFRARAYAANAVLSAQFPDPTTADGAAVVLALKGYYPIP